MLIHKLMRMILIHYPFLVSMQRQKIMMLLMSLGWNLEKETQNSIVQYLFTVKEF